jgi:predicted CopG family antitoxin
MASKNITISDEVYEGIRKIAAKSNKSIDDVADEILSSNMKRFQDSDHNKVQQ